MRFSKTLWVAILGAVTFCKVPCIVAQNPEVIDILDDVRIDSMKFFVQQLTGEQAVNVNGQADTIFSRYMGTPGNELAFQFAKKKFMDYGMAVDSLAFGAFSGKNLLGILVGTQFPEQIVMLGAHYDNLPVSATAPGADDNASGSAAVLEAARVFSGHTFPYTVIFALWDEEEQGLIGSKAYAAYAASNDLKILAYINVDMLGWDSNDDHVADIHVRPIAQSIQLANKAVMVDSLYEIGLGLHVVNPGFTASDHASFWNEGYTAIAIAEEYDNDFNPFWHTLADTLGHFNLPFYEKVAKLALATLGECALGSTATGSGEAPAADSFMATIHPNPSPGSVRLEYSLPFSATVSISIFEPSGKMVETFNIPDQPPGSQSTIWEAVNFPAGIYLCRWQLTPVNPNAAPVELIKPVILSR
jgi:hypothetical protein